MLSVALRWATTAISAGAEAGVAQKGTATGAASAYGFRYDPMEFVNESDALQAALMRKSVFGSATAEDAGLIQAAIDTILDGQFPDGTLSDDPDHALQFTSQALGRLAEMGCPSDRPEVRKAVAAIMGNPEPNQVDPLGIYDIRTLCLLGLADDPRYAGVVRDGLRHLLEREDEWGDIWEGCPWTPIEHLITLWHGRDYVDTAPTVARWVARIAQDVNQVGCLSYKDPWGFVRLASEVSHPAARELLAREVPVILRGQESDGGWGDRSVPVLRALGMHGLLEPLCALPPLPPDWEVVRTIPAPADDCHTLAWDGGRLWTCCADRTEAVAVSATDGEVLRRIGLPDGSTSGVGRWDDGLAVSQSEPKRLMKLNAETGDIEQTIALENMEWINGVTQAGDRLVVGDGFLGCGVIVDPENPEKTENRVLGGPIPKDLAGNGSAVWHVDVWAPFLIKSDLSRHGALLDWGEKPFGGDANGIALAADDLWALDARQSRICLLRKAAS